MGQRWICLRMADTLHMWRKALGSRRSIYVPSISLRRSPFPGQKTEKLRFFRLTETGLDSLPKANSKRCLCEVDLHSQSAMSRSRQKQVGARMGTSWFDQSSVLDYR